MGWTTYIAVVFGFACLFFIGAAFALHWAHRHGQLENLDEGARSIFDEEEPEGVQTDQFPDQRSRQDSD